MVKYLICSLCSLSFLASVVFAAESYVVPADLKTMYQEDQADREGPTALFGKKEGMLEMLKRDRLRRAKLESIISAGKITTAEEYFYAAMLLQHGEKADDYLRAHVLAGIAAQKGFEKAKWLSAATLDRYLMKIGQAQIFGTQYNKKENTAWSQEPLDGALISDDMRASCGVPSLAEAKKRLAAMNAGDNDKK